MRPSEPAAQCRPDASPIGCAVSAGLFRDTVDPAPCRRAAHDSSARTSRARSPTNSHTQCRRSDGLALGGSVRRLCPERSAETLVSQVDLGVKNGRARARCEPSHTDSPAALRLYAGSGCSAESMWRAAQERSRIDSAPQFRSHELIPPSAGFTVLSGSRGLRSALCCLVEQRCCAECLHCAQRGRAARGAAPEPGAE